MTSVQQPLISEPAQAFLRHPHGSLIDGQVVPAQSGSRFETLNPATGTAIGSVAEAGVVDVDAAVRAACQAFDDGSLWRRMTPRDRGRAIARLAALIDEKSQEFAELESLDNGKPLKFARAVDVSVFTALGG